MGAHPIDHIRGLMLEALAVRGIEGEDAEFLARDYLDAQLDGHVTHGIGKFLLLGAALEQRDAEGLRQIAGRGAYVLFDGGREIGQLAARHCAQEAGRLASEHGVGVVGLVNAGRFGRLASYGQAIADAGHVGIVLNNAGPPAVTPHGSVEPVLGTNPICFAFPAPEASLVIDFSTAARVWGEIRQAMLEGRPLPSGAFLDRDGRPTTDAERADAVLPFGGHKGFALCLAVELLAGSLTGARMGLEVTSEYDLGAVFLALDASGVLGGGSASVGRLRDEVRASRPAPGIDRVRVPGDRAAEHRRAALVAGSVTVDDETFERLREMSRGVTGGLEATAKLN
jgi:LDH2 family malate/lactate/ureidoglycolate dehydrogenase